MNVLDTWHQCLQNVVKGGLFRFVITLLKHTKKKILETTAPMFLAECALKISYEIEFPQISSLRWNVSITESAFLYCKTTDICADLDDSSVLHRVSVEQNLYDPIL